MIPYAAYKVLHYLGVFLLVGALSAALARAAARLATGEEVRSDPWAKRLAAAHGVAAFLVLLGGFGMLARLDVTSGLALPGWVWAKLGIWTLLAAAISARRSERLAGAATIATPLLAALAGWIALYKPI